MYLESLHRAAHGCQTCKIHVTNMFFFLIVLTLRKRSSLVICCISLCVSVICLPQPPVLSHTPIPLQRTKTVYKYSSMASSNFASTSLTRSCNNSLTITCSFWNKRNTKKRVFNGHSLISVWTYWPVSN